MPRPLGGRPPYGAYYRRLEGVTQRKEPTSKRMLYQVAEPPYPLSLFVSSLWYGENVPQHALERFLPTGHVDIVINVRDATFRIYDPANLQHPRHFSGPLVSGAHSRYYVIDTLQQASLMGLKFRYGGAYPFLGDAVNQLQDKHVALKDLWGREAMVLQETVMEAKTPGARLRCLEQALLARLSTTVSPHPAVSFAVSHFVARQGVSSVSTVVGETDLSPRRFIEVFRREVGLPPKLFCRLLRFRQALRLIAFGPRDGLTGLAVDCGYYDQAHLIREFKEFTGLTPTAYLATAGTYDNHVPLTERGQIYPIHSETPLLYS